jgi:Fe-S-cluster containining protein
MGAHPTDEKKPDARFRSQDRDFVILVDAAFADAAMRSGPHLLCRPGCTQCCVGAFAIGPADALRLRHGLSTLQQADPERAARVRARAAESWSRLESEFPGDATSGLLDLDPDGDLIDSFEDFANEELCPALDPTTGTCDLYSSRPQTCRVFGPPIKTGDGQVGEGYGICELCFHTATAQEVADAAIAPPPVELSTALDEAAISAGESSGSTIIAFVLNAG